MSALPLPSTSAPPSIPGFDPGGCFGKGGPDMGAIMRGLGQQAIDKLTDMALGKLGELMAVKDTDPAALAIAKHLASQFGSDIFDALQNPDEFMKTMKELFRGVDSKANVRIGWALPKDGPNMVHVNGHPATRLHDICEMPWSPDVGEYKMGNPTVIINGEPATGEIHIAQGKKGTIATPAEVSPNVFMGEATISLKLDVRSQAPALSAAAANKGGAAPGGGAAAKNGGGKRPPLTDADRRAYESMQNKDDGLARQQQEASDRADRGEITPREAQDEIDRIQVERSELARDMEKMRSQFDPNEFDSDGYLIDRSSEAPPTRPEQPSEPPAVPPSTPDQNADAASKAAKLRADARKMEGLSNLAALAGQDHLSEVYASAADAARIAAAQLEGGLEAAARESEQITARRVVEKGVDKAVKLIPPGPVRKVAEWAALPIGDGGGQLTEEAVEWLQKHGYIK